MKKIITFTLFIIVTFLSIGFHIMWWWKLIPTFSSDDLDPIQGVWVGYILFTILTIGFSFVFYDWWKTGEFKMP